MTNEDKAGLDDIKEQIRKARQASEKIRRDAFGKLVREAIKNGEQIGDLIVRALKIKIPEEQLNLTMRMAAIAAFRRVVRAGFDSMKMVDLGTQILAAVNQENARLNPLPAQEQPLIKRYRKVKKKKKTTTKR